MTSGAQTDFEEFVAARSTALWRSAYLLTGDPHKAEDLLQTALVKAWRRWDSITRREAAGVLRPRRASPRRTPTGGGGAGTARSPTGELPETAAAAETAGVEVRRDVLAALALLPRGQRAVVVLRFFDDLTEQQTAAALGVSVGTVKSQTSRALAALRTSPLFATEETSHDRHRPAPRPAGAGRPRRPDLDPTARAAAVARRGRAARTRDRACWSRGRRRGGRRGRRRPLSRGATTARTRSPPPRTASACPADPIDVADVGRPPPTLGDVVAVRSCPANGRAGRPAPGEPLIGDAAEAFVEDVARCRPTSSPTVLRGRRVMPQPWALLVETGRRRAWSLGSTMRRLRLASPSTAIERGVGAVVAAFEGNLPARVRHPRLDLPDRRPAGRGRRDVERVLRRRRPPRPASSATAPTRWVAEYPTSAASSYPEQLAVPRRPGREPRSRAARALHRHRPAAADRARGRDGRPGRLGRRALHRRVRRPGGLLDARADADGAIAEALGGAVTADEQVRHVDHRPVAERLVDPVRRRVGLVGEQAAPHALLEVLLRDLGDRRAGVAPAAVLARRVDRADPGDAVRRRVGAGQVHRLAVPRPPRARPRPSSIRRQHRPRA